MNCHCRAKRFLAHQHAGRDFSRPLSFFSKVLFPPPINTEWVQPAACHHHAYCFVSEVFQIQNFMHKNNKLAEATSLPPRKINKCWDISSCGVVIECAASCERGYIAVLDVLEERYPISCRFFSWEFIHESFFSFDFIS